MGEASEIQNINVPGASETIGKPPRTLADSSAILQSNASVVTSADNLLIFRRVKNLGFLERQSYLTVHHSGQLLDKRKDLGPLE